MTVKARPEKQRGRRRADSPRKEPREEPLSSGLPGHALLWGDGARPKRGPKPGLDLERIVRAAIEIADAEGLPAFSMQRVAQHFEFTTMSLYRYVSGRAELLALMTDAALGKPPRLEGLGRDWRPKLEAWTRALAAVYTAHRWTLEVTASYRAIGPNELEWMDTGIAALLDTGLEGSEMFDSLFLLLGHVRAATQYAVIPPGDGGAHGEFGDWETALEALIRSQSTRFPALLRAVDAGAFSNPEGNSWEFGLRAILDGIAVRIRERAEG